MTSQSVVFLGKLELRVKQIVRSLSTDLLLGKDTVTLAGSLSLCSLPLLLGCTLR